MKKIAILVTCVGLLLVGCTKPAPAPPLPPDGAGGPLDLTLP